MRTGPRYPSQSRARMREYERKYEASRKGRVTRARYARSEAKRRSRRRYAKSAKARETVRMYMQSAQGRRLRRASDARAGARGVWRRYYTSERGRAMHRARKFFGHAVDALLREAYERLHQIRKSLRGIR